MDEILMALALHYHALARQQGPDDAWTDYESGRASAFIEVAYTLAQARDFLPINEKKYQP
jgi:hypothetical protein